MHDRYLASYSVRGLPRLLAKCAAALLVLHVVVMTIYWRDVIPPESYDLRWWQVAIFDLDTEESLGTWFSALLLLIAGRFLWLQGRSLAAAGDGSARWWWVLAVGFHLLSLDEVAGLHEYLNESLKEAGGGLRWTVVGGPLAALIGIAYVPWLLRLPSRTRWTFILGGALYLGGAVLVERATDVYETWGKLDTLEYHMWIALEEGLEMFGVIVFLRGLLGHMAGAEDQVAVASKVEA